MIANQVRPDRDEFPATETGQATAIGSCAQTVASLDQLLGDTVGGARVELPNIIANAAQLAKRGTGKGYSQSGGGSSSGLPQDKSHARTFSHGMTRPAATPA